MKAAEAENAGGQSPPNLLGSWPQLSSQLRPIRKGDAAVPSHDGPAWPIPSIGGAMELPGLLTSNPALILHHCIDANGNGFFQDLLPRVGRQHLERRLGLMHC
jgi:hypothetical protein